jgi:hypothetical protein
MELVTATATNIFMGLKKLMTLTWDWELGTVVVKMHKSDCGRQALHYTRQHDIVENELTGST